jgi:hypothetical protein
MEPPRLAGGRFEALEIPGGDAAEFVARSLAAQPGLHRATVIVTGPAAEADSLTRWLGATVEHLAGQRSRLTLTADATPWLASMVAMIATHIDVEIETAPDDVRERVSVAAARLAGAGAR